MILVLIRIFICLYWNYLKLKVLIDSLIVINNLKLFRFWLIIGKLSYVLSMLDNICYYNIV